LILEGNAGVKRDERAKKKCAASSLSRLEASTGGKSVRRLPVPSVTVSSLRVQALSKY